MGRMHVYQSCLFLFMSCWHTRVPYLLHAPVHGDEVLALVVRHRRAQIQITTGQSGHNDAISHFRDTAPVPHAKKYFHGFLAILARLSYAMPVGMMSRCSGV